MKNLNNYITEKLKINNKVISKGSRKYTYEDLAAYLSYIGEVNLNVEKIFDHDIYFKKRKEDRYKIISIYTMPTNKSPMIFVEHGFKDGYNYGIEEAIFPEDLFDTFTEDEFDELCLWCEERYNE